MSRLFVRVAAVLLALGGCGAPPPPEVERAPVVRFAGCAAVDAGPVCVLGEDALMRLWVDAPWADTLSVAGGTAGPARDVGGGRLLGVRVEAGATEVRLTARGNGARGTWRIAVAPPRPDPVAAMDAAALQKATGEAATRGPALDKLAREARKAGELAKAVGLFREASAAQFRAGHVSGGVRSALMQAFTAIERRDFAEAHAALAGLDAYDTTWHEAEARRIFHEAVLARDAGDFRAALEFFERARSSAERLEMPLAWNVDVEMATTRLRMGQAREAERAFAALHAGMAERSKCDQAAILDNRAWIALLERERTFDALAEARPGEWLAESLGLYRGQCPGRPLRVANALVNLALDAVQAGRFDDAQRRLAEAAALPDAPEILAWRLAIEARLSFAAGKFEEARARYEDLGRLAEATAAAELRWRAEVGRGRALEALGDREGALAAYRTAEAQLSDESMLVPVDEGRVHFLADREASARRLVDLLVDVGRAEEAMAVARRARRRALPGGGADRVARLSAARRQAWETAYAEYRRERDAVEAEGATAWALTGREREAAATERAERLRRMRAALDRAVAVLGGAGEVDAPLRPPAEGEAILIWFPGDSGWIVFGATTRGVVAKRIGAPPACTLDAFVLAGTTRHAAPATLVADAAVTRGVREATEAPVALAARTIPKACAGVPDPDATASAWLFEPLADVLAGARRLRLLAYGRLRDVDLHTMPWQGRPLVEHFVVAWSLDVGESGTAIDADRALLVADPKGDLLPARDEANDVRRALTGTRYAEISQLTTREATRQALLEALPKAGLLHYAGHGVFAGREGWDSALPLAEGSSLTVSDILTLGVSPAWVVLSACETARSEAGTVAPAESVGLAQAFLIAGARGVVAAVRPVTNSLARKMSQHLYDERRPGPWDPAAALARAQLALAAAEPASDWRAFRFLER